MKKVLSVMLLLVTSVVLLVGSFSMYSIGAEDPVIIVIDPGHGGFDPGAVATHDGVEYHEKDINLKLSKMIKQELEKYAGVKVYLTRNEDTYLSLASRVVYAKTMDADILVCIHQNSAASAAATGSEVYVSSGNYLPDMANQMKTLATDILKNLEALGLRNRGVKTSTMPSNEKYNYPNGAPADDKAIIRHGVLQGVPSLIVENAFISSPSDIAYLNNDEALARIAQCTVSALVRKFGLFLPSAGESAIPPEETLTQGGVTLNWIVNNVTYGDDPINLGAAGGNSSADYVYESTDLNVIDIVGNQAIIVGSGTATIYATKPGDNRYTPITSYGTKITVSPWSSDFIMSVTQNAEGTNSYYIKCNLQKVLPEGITPQGQVFFYSGPSMIGSGYIDASGECSIVWNDVTDGIYNLKASYRPVDDDGFSIPDATMEFNVGNVTPTPETTPQATPEVTPEGQTPSADATPENNNGQPQQQEEEDSGKMKMMLLLIIILVAVIVIIIMAARIFGGKKNMV